MSGDEVLVLMVSLAGGLIVWGKWCLGCITIEDFGRTRTLRIIALVVPLLALVLLFFALKNYASADVREDGVYLFLYMVFGLAWLALIMNLAGVCGFSFRDDWLEGGNPAAATAGTGALLGGVLAFAGGNIGDGPGWWVVLFCAVLSTGAFFLSWGVYALLSGAMDRVILEREFGSGIRLSGFLVTVGIIAGRSVAGNWEGLTPAVWDFVRQVWPLAPLSLGIGLIERSQNHAPQSTSILFSIFWLLVYLGFASVYLYWLGPFK